jgi:hypothetical protein
MISDAPQPGSRAAFGAFWRSLLVADWEDHYGPIRLSGDLNPAELQASVFYQNTRALLTALAESDGVAATATGNLNRAFVRQMFAGLLMPQRTRETMLSVCKVLNEQDVWALHLVRVVSESGGLLAQRKKKFQLTRAGRELLAEGQAGALFRKLFLSYFRKFDLHYDFFLREVTGIQETMAVILWRLDTIARDWLPVRGLAPQLLLPGVLAQLHQAMSSPHDTEEWILAGYVLNPLFDLGLIEKAGKSEWPNIGEEDRFRVTALWRSFISFGTGPEPQASIAGAV